MEAQVRGVTGWVPAEGREGESTPVFSLGFGAPSIPWLADDVLLVLACTQPCVSTWSWVFFLSKNSPSSRTTSCLLTVSAKTLFANKNTEVLGVGAST